ncbi:MAG: hypothetical protein PHO15_08820 [Eubacteriales bacterium]|nr:hypothetical protein [Eubacteriales bacterium]
MARFKRSAHRVSLAAMFMSMSLLFLYLASVLPTMRVAMYFLSSVFVMGLVLEEEIGLAFLMFAADSLLSLLLMPNILRVVPYVVFFGHYGIGKYYIETLVKDKIVRYIMKLLYYNLALVVMYFLAKEVLMEDVLGTGIAFWLLVVLAELAFVVYDYLFTKVTAYYYNHIRRFLMKS